MEQYSFRVTEKIKAKALHKTQAAPITIAFLGDSVTQGCFGVYQTSETAIETVYRYQDAYPELLHRKIATVFPVVQVNIINSGLSGDNAPGGFARLERDVLSFGKPDLVVVNFGLNDSGHGLDGIKAYTNALHHIFTSLRERDIETILLTPNMMCTYVSYDLATPFLRNIAQSISGIQNDGILDAYVDAARETARLCGVPICDVYAKWKKLSQCGADVTRLLENRINHPCPEMNQLFADSLFEMLFFPDH